MPNNLLMPPASAPQSAPPGAPPPDAQGGMPNQLMGAPAGPTMPPGLHPDVHASLPQVDQAKLVDAIHKNGYVNAELEELLSNPNVGSKDVIKAVGKAVANNIMSVQEAAGYLGQMPADPEELQAWLEHNYQANSRVQGQLMGELAARSTRQSMPAQAPGGAMQMPPGAEPMAAPPQGAPQPAPQNALMGAPRG